ncbi:MAG: hypothetical protein HJJLKODD_01492 [Phycisphaerae bacterium]|nr:hypothetical protein [Phycisphaerae bacterium]
MIAVLNYRLLEVYNADVSGRIYLSISTSSVFDKKTCSALMIYLRHQPSYPLNLFVDHLWYFSGFQPDYRRERMLPHGGTDLIINLDQIPKRLYDRDHLQNEQIFRCSWISGQQTRYILFDAQMNSALMGVRFRADGLYPFLQIPLEEFTDRVLESELIFGAQARALFEQLLTVSSPQEKFSILENFLQTRLPQETRPIHTIRRALAIWNRNQRLLSQRELAGELGISQKHLINLFKRHVGVTPKAMERLTRFQCVLRRLEQSQTLAWPLLAQHCGYYDQAHFIKEFQNFAGLTPTTYLTEKGEYLNFMPDDPLSTG